MMARCPSALLLAERVSQRRVTARQAAAALRASIRAVRSSPLRAAAAALPNTLCLALAAGTPGAQVAGAALAAFRTVAAVAEAGHKWAAALRATSGHCLAVGRASRAAPVAGPVPARVEGWPFSTVGMDGRQVEVLSVTDVDQVAEAAAADTGVAAAAVGTSAAAAAAGAPSSIRLWRHTAPATISSWPLASRGRQLFRAALSG